MSTRSGTEPSSGPMTTPCTRWPSTSMIRPSGEKAASALASCRRARCCVQPQRAAMAIAMTIRDLTANVHLLERGRLVDLIDPVAIEQMRVAAPAVRGRARRIVARIVIAGHVDRRASCDVTVIFLFQRVAVIFEMVEDVERASARILDQTGADLVAVEQDMQTRHRLDLGALHLGPAADGNDAIIRKAAQIGRGRVHVAVTEAAEGLVAQHMFVHAVEMVDHRHPAPADAEGGMHMGLGPLKNAGQLVPIVDGVEVEMLERRTGDDQPVIFFARGGDLLEGAIKALHMLGGGVLGLVFGHMESFY